MEQYPNNIKKANIDTTMASRTKMVYFLMHKVFHCTEYFECLTCMVFVVLNIFNREILIPLIQDVTAKNLVFTYPELKMYH